MKDLRALRWPATAAVLARLGYAFVLSGTKLSDDEISFWSIAGNIVHGRGFSYAGRATAWRPPLYTYMVAGLRWVDSPVRVVQVVQAVVGVATPLLLYVIVRRLGGSSRAALAAAWIGALYPPFVYFAGRVLSENLAIPLYLLALWATVEWLLRRTWSSAVWCGAAWGLSTLSRPTSLPLLLVAVAVGVLWHRRLRSGLFGAVVVVVVAAAFVVPWMVRNASAVGGPEPVTSNEGITLWAPNRLDVHSLKSVFQDPRYPGMQDYSVYGRAFPGIEALAAAHHFDFDHASEAAQDAWFRSLALAAIRADPLRFVGRTVARVGLVLLPAPDNASQTARTPLIDKVALWVTSGPVVLLGLVGTALLLLRRRDASIWMLALVGLASLLFTAVHLPYVRYRVGGLDPVLIPLLVLVFA
jgi:hypothetical protein